MTEATNTAASADKDAAKKAAAGQKAKEKAEKKAAEKAARDQAKTDKAAAKAKAKEDAKAAREASRLPRQNGVRRPKAETKCGQAWGIFDELSQKNGSPASIGESLAVSRAKGLNDNMVRSNYAAWRKYHGVSGRIAKPGVAAPAS